MFRHPTGVVSALRRIISTCALRLRTSSLAQRVSASCTIPHYIVLFVWTIAVVVVWVIAFFAILITGKVPARSV